ncbi:MAG: TolC family protein [Kiritimatiellaeota bacterium]|nr:TolC family protein [Kiritimatiellota bacterium]
MNRSSIACAVLLACSCGCTHFQPKPINPIKTAAAFDARTLNDAGLRQFIATNLHHDVTVWDIPALTLVAFYFHPDLDVARAQWAVALAGIRTAGERPNPSMTLAPGYDTTQSELSPWFPLVAFDIPIETAGKRDYRLAQANYTAEAARLRLAATAWQVRSRVRSSFVTLLAAHESEALLLQLQKLQDENLRLLEKQLAAGGASAFDLTQSRIAAQGAQLAWRDAQRKSIEALGQLAEALGVSVATLRDVNFSSEFHDKLPEAMPAADARRQALLRRADLLAALADYAAAQSALQLEIAKQYPDLHLGPGYQYDQGDNKWTLGLTLTLPLLNRNQGAIGEAEARRTEAAAKFGALQAGVLAELDRALVGITAAREKLADIEKMMKQLQKQERAAQAMQAAGEISQVELLALRLPLAAAALARLDAETQAQQALGAFEDAVQMPLSVFQALGKEGIPPSNPWKNFTTLINSVKRAP